MPSIQTTIFGTIALLLISGFAPSTDVLNLAIVPQRQNLKNNITPQTGKLIIPCQFEQADQFSEGLAAVVQDNKLGYIDRTGNFIIPPRFRVESPSIDFDSIYRFSEGLAAVMLPDERWIYIDKTGRQAFPTSFSSAYNFSNDLAAVWIGKKLSYINRTGKLVIPSASVLYDRKYSHFSEGLVGFAVPVDRSYRIGFMDRLGKVIISPTLQESQHFSEGLVAATPDPFGDWKWGYMDKTGKFIIPPQFGLANSFSEGLAVARPYTRDGLSNFGYINQQGVWVISPQFPIADNFSEGLAAVEIPERGKGYIDKTGKLVIAPQFQFADSFSEGLARVQVGNQFGYIDKTGKVVIPTQFDEANSFSEGLAAVYVNGQWGYIRRD